MKKYLTAGFLFASIIVVGGCAAVPSGVRSEVDQEADLAKITFYEIHTADKKKKVLDIKEHDKILKVLDFVDKKPESMIPCDFSGRIEIVSEANQKMLFQGEFSIEHEYIVYQDGDNLKSRKLTKYAVDFLREQMGLEKKATPAPANPVESEAPAESSEEAPAFGEDDEAIPAKQDEETSAIDDYLAD